MEFIGQRHLLLLGAGHAHVHVLDQLAKHRITQVKVTLISPYDHQIYSGMTPGLVAGRYSEADCQIPLADLVQAADARWVQGHCRGIDTGARTVQVTPRSQKTGTPPTSLPYDLLSIDTGGVLDRERLEAAMPGAATQALTIRPIETFAQRWLAVREQGRQRPLSVVVVGAGAAGVEMVFAAEESLRQQGVAGSRFTLLTGGDEVAASYPPGVRTQVMDQLQRRGITVLRDTCTGMSPGLVQLGSGATLSCDVPLVAVGTHAPAWLQDSGLALSDDGYVLVNAHQQSTSHPEVFAAGDVAFRADAPHARSGVYAVRAGPPLAHNLVAALTDQPLKTHRPPRHTLNLLSCGTRYAIASYGPLHAAGRWAWALKDRIDRGFMSRYRQPKR